ncbi:hypothetical protein ACWC9S_10495 [Streptomyces xiamenensis]
MTDRRRASGRQDLPGEEHNPFAAPPENQPDRPWRSRRNDNGDSGRGNGNGSGNGNGNGEDHKDSETGDDNQRSRWGSQWSRRQPGRGNGAFGEPRQPGGNGRDGGPGGGGPFGPRWDPTDPAQRHARYAVLAGLWGIFAGVFGWEWLGLLLGALALYWGISALRGGPKDEKKPGESGEKGEPEEQPAPEHHRATVAEVEGEAPLPPRPTTPPRAGAAARRSPVGMAIGGLVLAGMALVIVFTTYTVQLVYKDYFDCVQDALTTPTREACEDQLPKQLRPILGERN